jgi:hypothetical protein
LLADDVALDGTPYQLVGEETELTVKMWDHNLKGAKTFGGRKDEQLNCISFERGCGTSVGRARLPLQSMSAEGLQERHLEKA